MNKTVTINIAGLVFHIEEDAYARLKNYLDTLRMRFSNEEGRDEILADIESRIAEILTQKKGPAREVVIVKDIEEVIEMMGEPEVISDDNGASQAQEEARAEAANNAEEIRRNRRRLFRDPDDKVFGGVCSGLGHYFDVDPVWIRLGFAIMFFVFGTGVLFYILLMIIIPKAETTAEKLEMKGEPVDVNNISRSIREEFEEFGDRMKKFGKEAKDWGKHGYDNRNRSRYHRNRRGAEDFFRGLFHIIGRAFAFALVFFGILFLIGLLTGTFFITDFGPDMISGQVKSLFDDVVSYDFAVLAGLLFFGVPILMMIYYGIKVLFKIKRNDKWIGLSAIGVWIIGLIMGIFAIANIASGFSEASDTSQRIAIVAPHDTTLTLRVDIDEDMINEDYNSGWDRQYRYGRRWKMVSTDETTMKFGYATLNIVPSTSDSTEMIVYKKAHGRTKEEAKLRANEIQYPIAQDSGVITFPSAFTIGKDQWWKAQEVDVELRVPVGTVVFIDRTCSGLVWDVKNVSETEDRDMVDRRWIMTKYGLECVDCAGLEVDKNSDRDSGHDYDTIRTDHGDTILIDKHPH